LFSELKIEKGVYVPLVYNLASSIFNPQSSLRDVKVHSSVSGAISANPTNSLGLSSVVGGVGSLFNKLGLNTRMRPDRRNTIVLFFVGGVTWFEIRELLSFVEAKNAREPEAKTNVTVYCPYLSSKCFLPFQIIIMSTTFASKEGVLKGIIQSITN
jgi:hypothetical protein